MEHIPQSIKYCVMKTAKFTPSKGLKSSIWTPNKKKTHSIKSEFWPLFVTPTSSPTKRPLLTNPQNHFGTNCPIQHSDVIRQRRRLGPQDNRPSKEKYFSTLKLNMEHFCASGERAWWTAQNEYFSSRHQSKATFN
jgi:hypothetical protein